MIKRVEIIAHKNIFLKTCDDNVPHLHEESVYDTKPVNKNKTL